MSSNGDLARLLAKRGGVGLDNGIVTEVHSNGWATVDLGAKPVLAKVPRSLRGVVAKGSFTELIGVDNVWFILSVLSEPKWVRSGFTASSGWTIPTDADGKLQAGYRMQDGPYITVAVRLQRTGSTITASSTGHLADEIVGTVPMEAMPSGWPLNSIPFVWRTSWSIGGGFLGPLTGNLVLTDLHPNASISAGDQMQMQLTYPA